MSTIKSDTADLTLNADGASSALKLQIDGVEKASISSAGAFTSTTIDATKLTGTIPNFTSTGIDDNATSTAITIDASENVGIGTFSSSGSSCGVKTFAISNGANPMVMSSAPTSANSDHYQFYNTNGECGKIRTNGSSTSYNTSSDYRLKNIHGPITDSITRVKSLKPYRFNFIANPDTTVDGFVAHEAGEVVPEAISGEKDAMRMEEYEITPAVEEVRDDEGNIIVEAVDAVMGEREVIDPQGIDQSKLVPLLTSALQTALSQIEDLTARIELLENN